MSSYASSEKMFTALCAHYDIEPAEPRSRCLAKFIMVRTYAYAGIATSTVNKDVKILEDPHHLPRTRPPSPHDPGRAALRAAEKIGSRPSRANLPLTTEQFRRSGTRCRPPQRFLRYARPAPF